MGLLDSILGSLGGQTNQPGQDGTASPLQSILGGLMGAGGAAGAASAIGTLVNDAGGVQGIVAKLQSAGLGDAVQSWVGSGSNQPVSPGELGDALGQSKIGELAQQAGLNPQDLLAQLSQHLPGLIDTLTPNGHVDV